MSIIAQTILPVFISAFLAILFLQSGLDKVFDWKGNLQFHTEHFARSPLNRFSKPMLILITILEVTCGALLFCGFIQLMRGGERILALYGTALSSIIFICLFFGQRVSKDYKGAAVLVPYFILSIIGIALIS